MPPVGIPPVGDTPGRTNPPSPQPGSGPGTGTTRVGDSPSPQGGGRRVRRIAAGGPSRSPSTFRFSLNVEGSSKGERVSLMETLSLREMIWLAHSSAWASPSLVQRPGANPRIVHAEHSAAAPKWGQWPRRSAWSEEGIRGTTGIRPGLGGRRRARTVPIHAERRTVRICVPHGMGPESLRACA